MATKFPKHIERRHFLHGIELIDGFVLISRDDDSKTWHIAWLEMFARKAGALNFAGKNGWRAPFQAVRASLAVTIKPPATGAKT